MNHFRHLHDAVICTLATYFLFISLVTYGQDVKLYACRDATGNMIFTSKTCDEVIAATTPKEEELVEEESEDEEEAGYDTSDPRGGLNQKIITQIQTVKLQEDDLEDIPEEPQVDNMVLPENTIFDSDDFLTELDPEEANNREPEYDKIIVEYAIPGVFMDECCIRVGRGTQASAKRICEGRGKRVWRMTSSPPLLNLAPPHKINNNCHVHVVDKADSEYVFSCSMRAVAKCYWE